MGHCQRMYCVWYQVEGLLDEEDFSYKVTREQFYSLIEDLLGRVRRPVVDALRASEVTLVCIGLLLVGLFIMHIASLAGQPVFWRHHLRNAI